MICSDCHQEKPDSAFRPGIHASVCFGCRVGSVQFTGVDERSIEVRKRDREFAADSAAYRRLKADGLQPKGVNKSAMAEKLADSKVEIELGHSIPKDQRLAYTRNLGQL